MYYDKQHEVIPEVPEAPVKQREPWQEICLKAAAYLRRHGRCVGVLQSDERVCLVGALYLSSDQYWGKKWENMPPTIREAYEEISKFVKRPAEHWNDYYSSDHQVLSVLEYLGNK